MSSKHNIMLAYKILGGDVLVFKNHNDCMTISRNGWSQPVVSRIEVDGEDMDKNPELRNPFTRKEVDYFLKNYDEIVGPNY